MVTVNAGIGNAYYQIGNKGAAISKWVNHSQWPKVKTNSDDTEYGTSIV